MSSRPAPDPVFKTGARPRIAVSRLWQETNSFNPLPTRWPDFDIVTGEAVFDTYRGSATPLGGIVGRLEELGAQVVPTIAATARPGGPVEDEAYARIKCELLDRIAEIRPDAVCLELHGSVASASEPDVEGDLLESLRDLIGPGVPIVVALDLHGHVTDRMVSAADLLTGYRTQPHSDLIETGERAADLLTQLMLGAIRPIAKRISMPFLALSHDETDEPPLESVRRTIDRIAAEAGSRLIDLSVFNVHPFLDIAGMGQVVLAYADAPDLADASARVVSESLLAVKSDFVRPPRDAEAQLAEIIATCSASRLIVVGDQGDSVLAGTPGDSVEIARYISQHAPALRCLFPVFDPVAVRAAMEVGIGGRLSLAIGGAASPGLHSLRCEVIVDALTDGAIVHTGSYMQGLCARLGPSSVLSDGPRRFLVTSHAPSVCDPALIAHAGLDERELDLLVVKSGNHFKLSFPLPYRCEVVATAGLSNRNPRNLRHRAARPIYPIDHIAGDAQLIAQPTGALS